MANLLLIHWHEDEAAERAERLRAAGHRVSVHWRQQGEGWRAVRAAPPDGIVLDLARLPSHGRAVAMYLRQTKATRNVPLVVVKGDAEKTAKVREMVPDAEFTTWRGIRGALGRALRSPPADPVVPRSTSGYSGTPLTKKLGVKAGVSVVLIDAPKGFERTLGALPEGVELRRGARGASQIAVLFAPTRAALARRFATAERTVAEGGRLWIAWPKKTSELARDLSENDLRAFALPRGWVDFKVCAVDADWSGLCFARRRA
jgi:CheY-like chemotaxis protein